MNNPKPPSNGDTDFDVNAAIKLACKTSFGVLDSNFLCQSLGILDFKNPIFVKPQDKLIKAVSALKENKIGAVLVVDEQDKLCGIFSERDCILKVLGNSIDFNQALVSEYMTSSPTSATPDVTIAYALNLMSLGGFRHLPIVTEDNTTIAVVSIKDIVDHLVESFTSDLMQFEIKS